MSEAITKAKVIKFLYRAPLQNSTLEIIEKAGAAFSLVSTIASI